MLWLRVAEAWTPGMGERQAGLSYRLDTGPHVTGCFETLWVQGRRVPKTWHLQTGESGGSTWPRALAPSRWASVGWGVPQWLYGQWPGAAGARAGEEGGADTTGAPGDAAHRQVCRQLDSYGCSVQMTKQILRVAEALPWVGSWNQ